MLFNDLAAMLLEVPPVLAGQWGAWFFLGLMLSIWGRREKARLVVHGKSARPKSGVTPPSGLRAPARPAKAIGPSAGDAFGELEAILESPAGTHRMPGESPALDEAPRSPVLAAPQSLP